MLIDIVAKTPIWAKKDEFKAPDINYISTLVKTNEALGWKLRNYYICIIKSYCSLEK